MKLLQFRALKPKEFVFKWIKGLKAPKILQNNPTKLFRFLFGKL